MESTNLMMMKRKKTDCEDCGCVPAGENAGGAGSLSTKSPMLVE